MGASILKLFIKRYRAIDWTQKGQTDGPIDLILQIFWKNVMQWF